MEADLFKDVKKVPAIEFEIPKKVFMAHEEGAVAEDSLVARLVDFE